MSTLERLRADLADRHRPELAAAIGHERIYFVVSELESDIYVMELVRK